MEDPGLARHIFNDEITARAALEIIRWPRGPICIRCGTTDVDAVQMRRPNDPPTSLYACKNCERRFSVTCCSVLEQCPVALCVWTITAHAFSSNGYRVSSFLKLQAEAGIPCDTLLCLWNIVRTAARQYQGYKRGFSKMITAEMEVTCLRRWRTSALAVKLLEDGKHQSQNTIVATGSLLAFAPPRVSRTHLAQPECLIRLLLLTSASG